MLGLTADGVTAADAALANLLGWGVVVVGVLVTIVWLYTLYR